MSQTLINTEIPTQSSLYLHTLNNTPLLSPEEEIELSYAIHGPDPEKASKALEKMVLSNLRLAIKIANEYKNLGADLEDLIAEAQIGLHKAAQRFNPKKAKFSTYASWWIKQTIRRYLNKHARTVRLPVHLSERIAKLKRVILTIEQETGHPPTTEEIAEITGMASESIERLLSIDKKTLSLHPNPTNQEESYSLEETLHDPEAPCPSQIAQTKQSHQRLNDILKLLNTREKQILTLRFGLDGKTPQTLDTIGETFGITRERIRQVQNNALLKLRKAYEKMDLKKILAENPKIEETYLEKNTKKKVKSQKAQAE